MSRFNSALETSNLPQLPDTTCENPSAAAMENNPATRDVSKNNMKIRYPKRSRAPRTLGVHQGSAVNKVGSMQKKKTRPKLKFFAAKKSLGKL